MGTTAVLLSGTILAANTLEGAKRSAATFAASVGRAPCLATVLVGDDPSSVTYVRMKQNRAARSGVMSRDLHLPSTSTTAEVVDAVRGLSADDGVDGILLQHPIPHGLDERAAFEAISPDKDVDGVTMHSFAAMAFGSPGFVSCTPGGIIRLLDHYDVGLEGANAVVIGRSPILGKPLGMLLLGRNATVTYCHSRTRDLPDIVARADLVVAAVGIAGFVRGAWLRPGAIVVDAGYNEGNVGDIAFDEVADRAGMVTPVPGGVGPMTIALLVEQTVTAAFRRAGLAADDQA